MYSFPHCANSNTLARNLNHVHLNCCPSFWVFVWVQTINFSAEMQIKVFGKPKPLVLLHFHLNKYTHLLVVKNLSLHTRYTMNRVLYTSFMKALHDVRGFIQYFRCCVLTYYRILYVRKSFVIVYVKSKQMRMRICHFLYVFYVKKPH